MVGEITRGAGRLHDARPRIGVGLTEPIHIVNGCMNHCRRLALFKVSQATHRSLVDHLLVRLLRLLRVAHRAHHQEPQKSKKASRSVFAPYHVFSPSLCIGFKDQRKMPLAPALKVLQAACSEVSGHRDRRRLTLSSETSKANFPWWFTRKPETHTSRQEILSIWFVCCANCRNF